MPLQSYIRERRLIAVPKRESNQNRLLAFGKGNRLDPFGRESIRCGLSQITVLALESRPYYAFQSR